MEVLIASAYVWVLVHTFLPVDEDIVVKEEYVGFVTELDCKKEAALMRAKDRLWHPDEYRESNCIRQNAKLERYIYYIDD